ncbi:MAG: exodeoxyribonuclease VII large subunit [Clostridia bacterium]|nr:exodeoxyribonuclease VII large subunit [Clostridia bacterium]
MAGETVFTVAGLNEYAAGVLSNDIRLRSVRVSGEISGFKRHSSGHLYFNLKDSMAVIPCVMFRSHAARLRGEFADGLHVTVHGSVSIYPKDGKYQLYADGMKPDGEGELYRQFLLLQQRLGQEGLFDESRKRPLPLLPRVIGVATSEMGAAIRDIVTVIRRRFPGMNVLLAPCLVQGEDAPADIIAAINALQRFPEVDVIIAGRGGGSYEDLSCFNDEGVARAIAASRVPVVSAVGHETDTTIADFAADRRAPTPSAAAELCCPVYDDLLGQTEYLCSVCTRTAEAALISARSSLDAAMGSAAMANPHHSIILRRERASACTALIRQGAANALASSRERLAGASARLASLSPRAVLERGYAILTDDSGAVTGIDSLKEGQSIGIVMAGGRASASVTAVFKGRENER